jgi:uncharacterized membrane protein
MFQAIFSILGMMISIGVIGFILFMGLTLLGFVIGGVLLLTGFMLLRRAYLRWRGGDKAQTHYSVHSTQHVDVDGRSAREERVTIIDTEYHDISDSK